MDLWRSVDLYCERTGPEFWSEPVNALSNVAFIVAAALIGRHARARGEVAPDAWLLAALVALVGAGSFLFHTLATVWAGWLDVIFILAFITRFWRASSPASRGGAGRALPPDSPGTGSFRGW